MSNTPSIKPASVNRDESGFWWHPECPSWDEGVDPEIVMDWFDLNKIKPETLMLENSVDTEAYENYLDSGNPSCLFWKPESTSDNAFLLAIHDTEDGPAAVFAVPVVPASEDEPCAE